MNQTIPLFPLHVAILDDQVYVTVTLPNTKVRLVVPLRTYYLAVKDGIPNRSILPDYEVKPSISDLLSDTDPAMSRAMELAKRD